MTDLQINQLIAEYCGWQILEPEVHPTITYHWAIEPDGSKSILPDYCNDLNAIHEAENTLKDPIQQSFYAEYLGDCNSFEKGEYPTFRFVNSTAKERAVAFLKVVGKWEK